VTAARDAETGLKLARKSKPDLILLDIMLPKMDGLEFLRTIRPEVDIPIILLSAKRSEMDRILGLKLGADDYMVKPFSIGELQARITGHLRRHAGGTNGSQVRGIGDSHFERHEILVAKPPTSRRRSSRSEAPHRGPGKVLRDRCCR
jgi:two-component system response regulator VicR